MPEDIFSTRDSLISTPIVVNPDHKLDLISKEKRWKKLTFKELLE